MIRNPMVRSLLLMVALAGLGSCSSFPSALNPFLDKGAEKVADKLFSPREITAAELDTLVNRAWTDMLRNGGEPQGFGAQTIAIAPVRMDSGRVAVPENIQADVQTNVERLAQQHPGYEPKSSDWVVRTLRSAGAQDIESLFEPDRVEDLRRYLRLGEVPVRYLLRPTFRATYYENDESFTYSVVLQRVDIESGTGDTVQGFDKLTL